MRKRAHIAENPGVKHSRFSPSSGRRRKLPKRLTREEAAQLIKQPSRRYPTGVRNRALLRLFYRSGLRCQEALDLKPRDVDLRRGEIRVNQGKGSRDRVVWIDETTVEYLAAWKDRRPRSEWFFCTLHGRHLHDSYVRKMVTRYGRKAGIETRCHPHLLRHTFATELLEDGFHIAEVQQLMGHEHIGTTSIYLHVADEQLRQRLLARE